MGIFSLQILFFAALFVALAYGSEQAEESDAREGKYLVYGSSYAYPSYLGYRSYYNSYYPSYYGHYRSYVPSYYSPYVYYG